ncbi:MAG TPA: glycosyltransferase, partial [Candidatus Limnocylindria bacterium]|nr:glycosyltransferase [Candidatus Limnocylindria bacterium]
RAALEERAAGLGIGGRVIIVDAIPHRLMAEYLRLADMVVSVPESDSFPVAVQEAMATGVPVVTSDLPAARAALEELAPDALVPVGDVDATATALQRAIELAPDERHAIGLLLREQVVAHGDYRSNMEIMEDLYRNLVVATGRA